MLNRFQWQIGIWDSKLNYNKKWPIFKNGFSLIELLITLTIIGILTSLAYPSYLQHLTKTRRSDGQTALLDLANRMEQHYAVFNNYLTATIGTGKATDVLNSNISAEHWYTLSITNQTDSSYILQATPINVQANNDKLCQSLTLTSFGVKNISKGPLGEPNGSPEKCW